VDALVTDGSGTAVVGLIEPFSWRAAASARHDRYPGTLTSAGDGGTLTLDANDGTLLRGFEGHFAEAGGFLTRMATPPPDTFQIVAGSMSAHAKNGKVRDQRGLHRGASEFSPASIPGLAKTPVLREAAGATKEVTLYSLLGALELTAADRTWRFWLRDLPAVATATGDHEFNRAQTLSPLAQDVNDPAATTPPHAHLSGYEWRLGDSQQVPDAPEGTAVLQLLGLQIFPLSLSNGCSSAPPMSSSRL
jgi:hypothetical protein